MRLHRLVLGLLMLLPALVTARQHFRPVPWQTPQQAVDRLMKLLPTQLKLTAKQKNDVRATYLDLANKEQAVEKGPGGFFQKRQQFSTLNVAADAKLQKLLNPNQWKILWNWEQHSKAKSNPRSKSKIGP